MKCFCVIAAIGVLLGTGIEVRAELVDGIQAVVHDSIITYQDVQEYTRPLVDQLRQQYSNDPKEFQAKVYKAWNDNLERLVENQLILHDFKTAGYNLPESVIDEQLEHYIRANYGDDRVRFIKTLQAEGKTYEEFRREFRDRFIVQQMRLARDQNVTIISPHKIEVYYEEHTNDFKVDEEVKLRMIVLNKSSDDPEKAHKLAEEILTNIKGGASFAQMASVYSQGSQRSVGGDWGWVEKSVLRKELAVVAFSLKPGETSGVINTPEACYLMRVDGIKPAHVKALKDVRDGIEKTLLAQEHDRMQKQWIDRLKKKTFILYF